jgi:hypothetical protein
MGLEPQDLTSRLDDMMKVAYPKIQMKVPPGRSVLAARRSQKTMKG